MEQHWEVSLDPVIPPVEKLTWGGNPGSPDLWVTYLEFQLWSCIIVIEVWEYTRLDQELNYNSEMEKGACNNQALKSYQTEFPPAEPKK